MKKVDREILNVGLNCWEFKSVWSASFLMNQGALDIICNTLDWKTWILLMWVLAQIPQIGAA